MRSSDLVLEEEVVQVSFLDLSTPSCQKLTLMEGKNDTNFKKYKKQKTNMKDLNIQNSLGKGSLLIFSN
jgi:hypothetical protein